MFRRQDAQRGVRVAQVLEGFISRKVVKQTVMTVVYGVTRYGGRLQIERRLRELSNFPQVRPLPLAPGPWRRGSRWPEVGWGGRPGSAPQCPADHPAPSRSSCGRLPTTWCARCSTASRRCSRVPGPSRCVLLSPPWAHQAARLGPALSPCPASTALADRERPAHRADGLGRGVGDTPGHPHHPALSPGLQSDGTSTLAAPPLCLSGGTHDPPLPDPPLPTLQIGGGIQSLTFSNSGDTTQ